MKTKHNSYAYCNRNVPAEQVIEERIIPFIISTGSRDRHGTVLSPANWQLENYRKNPVVAYAHLVWGGSFFKDPDPDTVIGKAVELSLSSTDLRSSVQFEPGDMNLLAEKIFQKVLFGSLSMASVGFLEIGSGWYGSGDEARHGKNETYYFEGQELVEWSVVNIPSNTDAKAQRSLSTCTPTAQLYAQARLGSHLRPSQIEKLSVEDAGILLLGKTLGIHGDITRIKRVLTEWEDRRRVLAELKTNN